LKSKQKSNIFSYIRLLFNLSHVMKRTLLLLSLPILFFSSCRQAPKPFSTIENQYTFQIDGGTYTLAAINDDIIKVSYQDSITYSNRTYAPILTDAMPMQADITDSVVNFNTAEVRVEVQLQPFRIQFFDLETGLKLSEEQGYTRQADTTSFRFFLQPQEAIYGTGARALPMDRRGYAFKCYNQPNYGYGMGADFLNYSIPHLYSSNQYMLLIDNPAKAYFDIGKTEEDVLDFSSLGGNMAYYFINGNNFEELISEYTLLTGRQPLPPLWALGHLQSRFGYKTRSQADSILNLALEAGYPVDAIILDIFWFGEEIEDGKMGQLDWDAENWPDPEGMIGNWREKGVKTITISEPFFTRKSKNFDYLADNDLLARDSVGNTLTISNFYFGDAGLLDIFKPEAQDWIWAQYVKQKKQGVEGWWIDLAEPEMHPDTMYHVNGRATEVHGLYGHEWTKNMFEKYAEDYPNERLFKLGRAGYAGSQRYGLIPWTGDVSRSWSGFQAQIPAMLGAGVSGIPYMHSDAGGFAGPDQQAELYIRWMQYAVFTPIFRPHSNPDVPAEPVLWEEEVQDIIHPWVDLRYRMIPYNYTLGWKAMTTGMPMARPLFTEFEVPETIEDQYLWGEALMVAPVLNPGVSAKSVYLPEGQWFDFWTNKAYEGGQWVEIPVSMDKIPVFGRAGHMVAMTPVFSNTDEYVTDSLDLTFYVGDESFTSEVYFDDGKTKGAFEKGAYQLLKCTFSVEEGQYLLQFLIEGNGYEGAPEARTASISIVGLEESPEFVNDEDEIAFEWNEESKVLTFQASIRNGNEIVIN
jgi:oligosaccharide 4-alpha-D-glucosyltransferase